MAKRVRAVLTLQLEGGKASPAPPVGPALGQHGVSIMDFVKSYNERTANKAGEIAPRPDHDLRGPLVQLRAENRARLGPDPPRGRPQQGLSRAATRAGRLDHPPTRCARSRKPKCPDLNANDIEAAMLMIAGTARSMGVEVKD